MSIYKNNRKHISYKNYIIHNKKRYKVNPGKPGVKGKFSGIYTPIMHKVIDELEYCEQKYKRVFVFIFELHNKDRYAPENTDVSKFFKRIKKKIKTQYNINEIGYVWAREQEKAKAQHYHCALFLDGDRINFPERLRGNILEPTWKYIHPDNTLAFPKGKSYYFYDFRKDTVEKEGCIYHLSYLAKSRGKGYRNDQTKDYGSSRLS